MRIEYEPGAPIRIPLEPLYWDKHPEVNSWEFVPDPCATWQEMNDGNLNAPHEPAAVWRAFKAGYRGTKLAAAVSMSPRQTVDSFKIAMEELEWAARQEREVHAGLINKGLVE